MKFIRMLSKTSKTEHQQEQEEQQNSPRKPKLTKKLKSLVINDKKQLARLNRELSNLMEMGSHMYTPTQSPNRPKAGKRSKLSNSIHQNEFTNPFYDSTDSHKFYKKRDVCEMIDLTKKHIEMLGVDLKHSVQQYKNSLELYKEVLASQGEMVGELGEEAVSSTEVVQQLLTSIDSDTRVLSDLVEGKQDLPDILSSKGSDK